MLTEAFNSATGVRVSWKPVEGAAAYRLLRKNITAGETVWSAVGTTTETSLIDTSAVSGQRYTFTVECVDGSGAATSARNETGRTCTYIAKPEITLLTCGNGGITIQWSKPGGAKNFRVFRKPDGGAWEPIADVLGTSYTDAAAQSGQKYWYTVRVITLAGDMYTSSYNSYGWSVIYLPAPVLTEAFNSATGVRVSWRPVEGAVKYRLLRKNVTAGDTAWTAVGTTAETTLIDTSAVSGQRYTFTVECVKADGSTVMSGRNETGRTCTYIGMAKITSLTSTVDGVKLQWSKPAGAKNFRVFRKLDGGEWAPIADIQGTSYTDTAAQSGKKYWYTVRVITLAGDMYTSSYNSVGWSVTYYNYPVIKTVTNVDGGVRITWNAFSGAGSYTLLRKNLTKSESEWSVVRSTTNTSTIDASAVSGNRYTYTVQCTVNGKTVRDETGRSCTYVGIVHIDTIEPTANGVKIFWRRPAGARNFRVFRRPDVGGSEWTALADVLDSDSYIDTTMVPGQVYWYRVRPITLAGDQYLNVDTPVSDRAYTRLEAPVITKVTANKAGIHLYWNPVDYAGYYIIYRMDENGEWKQIATTSSGPEYTDISAYLGETYSYMVRTAGVGRSVDSNVKTYRFMLPFSVIAGTYRLIDLNDEDGNHSYEISQLNNAGIRCFLTIDSSGGAVLTNFDGTKQNLTIDPNTLGIYIDGEFSGAYFSYKNGNYYIYDYWKEMRFR